MNFLCKLMIWMLFFGSLSFMTFAILTYSTPHDYNLLLHNQDESKPIGLVHHLKGQKQLLADLESKTNIPNSQGDSPRRKQLVKEIQVLETDIAALLARLRTEHRRFYLVIDDKTQTTDFLTAELQSVKEQLKLKESESPPATMPPINLPLATPRNDEARQLAELKQERFQRFEQLLRWQDEMNLIQANIIRMQERLDSLNREITRLDWISTHSVKKTQQTSAIKTSALKTSMITPRVFN